MLGPGPDPGVRRLGRRRQVEPCLLQSPAGGGDLGRLARPAPPEPGRELVEAAVDPPAVGMALGDLMLGGRQRVGGAVADGSVLAPELGGGPQPAPGGVDRRARARLDARGRLARSAHRPLARRQHEPRRPVLAAHAQLGLAEVGGDGRGERVADAIDLDPRLGQAHAAHRALDRLRERGVGGRGGVLDGVRAGDPLALAGVGGEPHRPSVLGERGVERVLGGPEADVLDAPFHGSAA